MHIFLFQKPLYTRVYSGYMHILIYTYTNIFAYRYIRILVYEYMHILKWKNAKKAIASAFSRLYNSM